MNLERALWALLGLGLTAFAAAVDRVSSGRRKPP